MRRINAITFFISTCILMISLCADAQKKIDPKVAPSFPGVSLSNYSFLNKQVRQTAFEENKGQITGVDADKVTYSYRSGNLSVFLLKTGIAYQFYKTIYPQGYHPADKFQDFNSRKIRTALEQEIRTEAYRMDVTLVGANPNAERIEEGRSGDYINYYNYDIPDVHSFSKITYKSIYPGIDWVIYKSENHIKYDFVIRPGGNPDDIVLSISDAENIALSDAGILSISNRMGWISEERPISYQEDRAIISSFSLADNEIRFHVENYDTTKTLVIDPVISWATYYGGGNDDFGQACATDPNGNIYLAGITKSLNNIASGGFSNTLGGGNYDAFLVKFNDDGQRLWATYYGGSGADYGYGCAVDASGNAYLSGTTLSSNNIGLNGFQNAPGGGLEAFLVKFNPSGQRLWGTYYGQSDDDVGNTCAVDVLGNIYLTGTTASLTGMAFEGFRNNSAGDIDAFLVKFKSNGDRVWATYYGASDHDEGLSCSTDGSDNVYLVGKTGSISGIASNDGFQSSLGGGTTMDAFLVKFNGKGERLWATYYGGVYFEQGQSCAIDERGNVYFVGYTISPDDIASGGFQNVHGSGYDAFLVKFDSIGRRDWATYYGGSSDDYGSSCVICDDNVYLSGYTHSSNGIASGGFQDTIASYNYDAFFVKFNSAGQREYSSYYGGIEGDFILASALGSKGNLYLAGYTTSGNNMAQSGFQDTLGGGIDAFLAKVDINCSIVTSIDKTQKEIGWRVFPNPVKDILHISYSNPINFSSLSITDIAGRELLPVRITESNVNTLDIDIRTLKRGLYFIKLISKDEMKQSFKFIKN